MWGLDLVDYRLREWPRLDSLLGLHLTGLVGSVRAPGERYLRWVAHHWLELMG